MNGVSNGHASGLSNGLTNGHTNGAANGSTNGHSAVLNGRSYAPSSASNRNSSGTGGSVAPPHAATNEQKMLGNGGFAIQNKPRVLQRRRRTLNDKQLYEMSAPAVLPPERLATRWSAQGVHGSVEHRYRRASNVPASSNSPRAASPDKQSYSAKRSHSPVSVIRSPMNGGAMSPVSNLRNEGILQRSQSPLSREFTADDSTKNDSPGRNGHAVAKGHSWTQQQQDRQAALAQLQWHTSQPTGPTITPKTSAQRLKQRLSLQTQIPAPPPVSEEEEVEEVISMSPAVREPIVSYRRSRASLAMSAGPGASSSQVSLSGLSLTSDPNRRYFGQTIDRNDLVATGIENAFTRL